MPIARPGPSDLNAEGPLDGVEVDEHEIRVIGSTEALHAVMTVGQNLRSSGPEWRARKDSNL